MSEYNSKLISKAEYFRKTRKYDDETAIQFVETMNQEIQIQESTISDGSEFDLVE